MQEQRIVVWFSCGAASAMAAKLAVEKYGERCIVVYCDTSKSEHPDNLRFLADVERWIGKPVLRIRSEKYTIKTSGKANAPSHGRRSGLRGLDKLRNVYL